MAGLTLKHVQEQHQFSFTSVCNLMIRKTHSDICGAKTTIQAASYFDLQGPQPRLLLATQVHIIYLLFI
jgi:hypothetical protein